MGLARCGVWGRGRRTVGDVEEGVGGKRWRLAVTGGDDNEADAERRGKGKENETAREPKRKGRVMEAGRPDVFVLLYPESAASTTHDAPLVVDLPTRTQERQHHTPDFFKYDAYACDAWYDAQLRGTSYTTQTGTSTFITSSAGLVAIASTAAHPHPLHEVQIYRPPKSDAPHDPDVRPSLKAHDGGDTAIAPPPHLLPITGYPSVLKSAAYRL
jgi:hypothetical protein